MVDNVSYIQGPAQSLVIIHHPHVSTASLSKGWGGGWFRVTYKAFLLCSQYLGSLGVAWVERGMGTLYIYIKYTWSIGSCATWCNIPAPSSWCSLVAFKRLNTFTK